MGSNLRSTVGMETPGPLLTYSQLQQQLKVEFSRARRYGFPIACLILEVDRLEHLRDLYGNAAREEIVREVVKVARGQTRASDCIGTRAHRLILILPHTDGVGATQIAERMRRRVAELPFEVSDKSFSLGVSMGIVASVDHEQVIFYDTLLKKAEQALEQALRLGGNRTEVLSLIPVE